MCTAADNTEGGRHHRIVAAVGSDGMLYLCKACQFPLSFFLSPCSNCQCAELQRLFFLAAGTDGGEEDRPERP